MKTSLLDMYSTYLLTQIRNPENAHPTPCAVTISREVGAGAITVAELLARYLQRHSLNPTLPWAVFERNLVAKVLEEHKLPASFESFMPEDASNEVGDTIENILGLHPPASTLARHMAETIFRLAKHGNVILVGRGSNLITARLPHVLHVRLVAPLQNRIRHVERYYHLSAEAAAKFVANSDRARTRYVSQHFNSRIDDPLAYHLILNTGRISHEQAAELIGNTALDLARKNAPELHDHHLDDITHSHRQSPSHCTTKDITQTIQG